MTDRLSYPAQDAAAPAAGCKFDSETLAPRVMQMEILFPPHRDRDQITVARAVVRIGPFVFTGTALTRDAAGGYHVALPNNKTRSRTIIRNSELKQALTAAMVSRFLCAKRADADPAPREGDTEDYEDASS